MDEAFDEEVFLRLVSLMRDDAEMVSFFKKLSELGDLQRNIHLTAVISDMERRQEDPSVVAACRHLRNPAVFSRLGELLEE